MHHDTPTRRTFVRHAGAGALAAFGIGALPPATMAAANNAGPMKITQIDAITFRKDLHIGGGNGSPKDDGAEFFWVRLHTDNGFTGMGETYPFDGGETGVLKDYADLILRHDPRDIDGLWRNYYHSMVMRNAGGAEMRVLSAINMAQLDILGQAAGLPLYRLLGGKTRSRVRVYNTTTDYWAIDDMKMGPDTMKIVRFLLDRGITGIKIYPFRAPETYLSNQSLEQGLKWIRDIRDNAGGKMDICVDCWGNFDLPSAQRIAKALEPYNIMYLEDAMMNHDPQAYARLASGTSVPICMSETLATRYEYRQFFEAKACSVAMYDVTWCGGPTEAKKIADMADTYFIPTSPHTCGGPLLYFCAAHVSMAAPNFLIMESNYWKYAHQYPHFINNVPVPVDGHVSAPENPGIGAEIRPEIFRNGDAAVEIIAKL
ncbi:MAG TPA: mandelate racemase/muconate lactonizing enzyme family protein [Bryobacteraceae bacterium]|nr:mandelate racemase/muconate lactonizing enzyme family protein [Bryobacteraceae bacterium]